jgi:hypothetical protein
MGDEFDKKCGTGFVGVFPEGEKQATGTYVDFV